MFNFRKLIKSTDKKFKKINTHTRDLKLSKTNNQLKQKRKISSTFSNKHTTNRNSIITPQKHITFLSARSNTMQLDNQILNQISFSIKKTKSKYKSDILFNKQNFRLNHILSTDDNDFLLSQSLPNYHSSHQPVNAKTNFLLTSSKKFSVQPLKNYYYSLFVDTCLPYVDPVVSQPHNLKNKLISSKKTTIPFNNFLALSKPKQSEFIEHVKDLILHQLKLTMISNKVTKKIDTFYNLIKFQFIQNLKGIRQAKGLPSNGQRTRSNRNTAKIMKKKIALINTYLKHFK